MSSYYDITPCAKPRMTRVDKWKKRPIVSKYRAFKDECRLKKVQIPESGAHIVFHVPMPRTWKEEQKREMHLMPHQQTPDVDNFCKGLLDALYENDSHIHDIRISKVWDYNGGIEVLET